MKNRLKKSNLEIAVFAALFFTASAFAPQTAIFAQAGKSPKTVSPKIEPGKIDPKKLFDAGKISKQYAPPTDLGVKGAYFSWLDYGKFGYRLDVIPVLTKNSKAEKIYALDALGKLVPIKISVQALGKNGAVLETCEKELLGWTVEETETTYPVCEFDEKTWKASESFRVVADSASAVKESNRKNNVAVVKRNDFTGKEYSAFVAPTLKNE